MPMVWDSPLVASMARELGALLRDARLRALRFRREERELALFFRTLTLRWRLHPTEGWVLREDPADPPGDARPLSARVLGVEAPPDERLLRVRLRRVRGGQGPFSLLLELMTNQWNALLLEGAEDRIRHLLHPRRARERVLAVGRRYQPPPPSRRRGATPPHLTLEEWMGLLAPLPPRERPGFALEEVAFSSPLNLPALLGEWGEERGGELRLREGYALWRALASSPAASPVLLATPEGPLPDPLPLPHLSHRPVSGLLEGMGEAYREGRSGAGEGTPGAGEGTPGTGEGAPASGAREALLERLEGALHQARGRVRGLLRELEKGEDPRLTRERADLLLARLRELPRGAPSAVLEGFQGEGVEVALDPARTPLENIQALYQEAARREGARARVPPLLERARARVRELEALREGVLLGEREAGEAARRLPPRRGSSGASPGGGEGPAREERLPYLLFRSSGGLEIRVGRGPRDNDALTFRHSSPGDVWLHARDRAGAHVILRWKGEGNPPGKDLMEAAVLAALHSGARGSGVVPVDWTRRKYVRKPRKAPPGVVVPERVKTLFVTPGPGVRDRLRGEGDQTR